MKPTSVMRFTVCAVTLLAMGVTQAAQTSAEAGWAAVTRCAQQETERTRHDCLDQVLRDAGVLTPELRQRQQQRSFGLPQPAMPPSAGPSPTAREPSVSVPDETRAPLPDSPPDRVEVQIAAVASGPDGKLIITTTDGAVWRQTETLDNRRLPVVGESMRIRRGALGGYLCTLASKQSWRCVRSR